MKVEIAWIEAGYAAEVAAMTGEENAAGVLSAIIAAVAPLIAAKEREECARVVEETYDPVGAWDTGNYIAAVIRARQEDKP